MGWADAYNSSRGGLTNPAVSYDPAPAYTAAAGFGNTAGGIYDSYSRGNTGIATAVANLYGQGVKSAGDAYDSYSRGNTGIATAAANLYGQGAKSAGDAQAARYTTIGNRYSAYGLTEAARQGTIGALGTAALGNVGSMTNNAQQAWLGNQQGYYGAASQMHGANQQAMSSYGYGQNNAYASTANSAGQLAGALGRAAGNLGSSGTQAMASGYGNSLNYQRDMAKLGLARELGIGTQNIASQIGATTPAMMNGLGGAIGGIGGALGGLFGGGSGGTGGSGSGASGGTGGGGGGYNGPAFPGAQYRDPHSNPQWYQGPQSGGDYATPVYGAMDRGFNSMNRNGDQGFNSINGSRDDIRNNPTAGYLNDRANAGQQQIDNAYYSSRNMPNDMLNTGLNASALSNIFNTNQSNQGMNQFYNAMSRPSTTSQDAYGQLDRASRNNNLQSTLDAGGSTLQGLRGDLNGNYTNAQGMNRSLVDAGGSTLQGLRGDLNGNYTNAQGINRSLFDDSIGGMFRQERLNGDPLYRQEQQYKLDDMRRERKRSEQERAYRDYLSPSEAEKWNQRNWAMTSAY